MKYKTLLHIWFQKDLVLCFWDRDKTMYSMHESVSHVLPHVYGHQSP